MTLVAQFARSHSFSLEYLGRRGVRRAHEARFRWPEMSHVGDNPSYRVGPAGLEPPP